MPAVASLAAAVAAWHQRGFSSGSTINNQHKASVAMATENVTMIATMTTIKMKGIVAAAAAWWQHGGQCGEIVAVAAALLQLSGGRAAVQQRQPKDVVGLLLGNSKYTII